MRSNEDMHAKLIDGAYRNAELRLANAELASLNVELKLCKNDLIARSQQLREQRHVLLILTDELKRSVEMLRRSRVRARSGADARAPEAELTAGR